MQSEFILLTVGVGMTALAAVVVFASMRRVRPSSAGEPVHAGSIGAAFPPPEPPDHAHVPPEKLILRGLQALLERDAGQGFVVFEHPGTKHFIQFVRSDGGVTLDFPLLDLDEAQRERARASCARQGLPVTQLPGSAKSIDSCRMEFGGDVERATRVAMELFREVFGLSGDFPLYVKSD